MKFISLSLDNSMQYISNNCTMDKNESY